MLIGIGIDDGDVMPAREVDEVRHEKALAPDFDDMAQRMPAELARQEREEGAEILRVEFLERRELPEHRPELLLQLAMPELKNHSTAPPASPSFLAFTTARWPFTEKTKPSGVSSCHLPKLFGPWLR